MAKLEEILPAVEAFGNAHKELTVLEKAMPNKLRASLLQTAVQGKLVPQHDDEPSVDIDAPEVKDTPFEIPEKWKWVRLECVSLYIQRGKSPKYSDIQKYPVISQKCNQWDGFYIENAKFIHPDEVKNYEEKRLLRDGDLLWNSTGTGTLGMVAVYQDKLNCYGWAVADSHVTVIRCDKNNIDYEYLYFYLRNPSVQNVIEEQSDGSTKQKELSLSTIKSYPIPLPPLAEQRRIVAKLEEMLPHVESMSGGMQKA